MQSTVSLRVGGGKSAYLATDRQIYSRRVKKLEGPLQKATLVPVVSTSELVNIPAAAEEF